MSETVHAVSIPAQRSPTFDPPPEEFTREVAIRELRNAGRVIETLADAGKVGKVTSGGRVVGWLVPVDPVQRRVDELVAQGRLSDPPTGSLSDIEPLPARKDVPPLSETLRQMRDESS